MINCAVDAGRAHSNTPAMNDTTRAAVLATLLLEEIASSTDLPVTAEEIAPLLDRLIVELIG